MLLKANKLDWILALLLIGAIGNLLYIARELTVTSSVSDDPSNARGSRSTLSLANRGQDVPRLVIEEASYDFGELDENSTVQHVFNCCNRGNASLIIESVKAGCGCTKATLTNHNIEPGCSEPLEVMLALKGKSGPQASSVAIVTNDPVNPTQLVTLQGKVRTPISVTPSRLIYASLPKGKETIATVDVHSDTMVEFDVLSVNATQDGLVPEVITIRAGSHYQIRVKIVPQEFSDGINGAITMRTSRSDEYKELTIPVVARFKGKRSVLITSPQRDTEGLPPLADGRKVTE